MVTKFTSIITKLPLILKMLAASFFNKKQQVAIGIMMKKLGRVILVRHGESIWNATDPVRGLQTRFTGWSNIPLTNRGIEQAKAAGRCLIQFDLHSYDAVYMSVLDRATKTYDNIRNEILLANGEIRKYFKDPKMIQHWRLNERHYGALVGLSKEEAETTMGREEVMGWRRSWDQRPPPMTRHLYFQSLPMDPNDKKPMFDWQTDIWSKPLIIEVEPSGQSVKTLEKNAVIPKSESLKDCADRVLPLWENEIVPRILAGDNVLIVAHSNTIRAMVKQIDKATLSDDDLRSVTIPSAIPMIYSFDRYGRAGVKPRGQLSPLGVRGRFVVNKEVLTLSLSASQHLEMSENLDDSTQFKDLLKTTLAKLSSNARVSQMSSISMSSFDEPSYNNYDDRMVMEPGWMSFTEENSKNQQDI